MSTKIQKQDAKRRGCQTSMVIWYPPKCVCSRETKAGMKCQVRSSSPFHFEAVLKLFFLSYNLHRQAVCSVVQISIFCALQGYLKVKRRERSSQNHHVTRLKALLDLLNRPCGEIVYSTAFSPVNNELWFLSVCQFRLVIFSQSSCVATLRRHLTLENFGFPCKMKTKLRVCSCASSSVRKLFQTVVDIVKHPLTRQLYSLNLSRNVFAVEWQSWNNSNYDVE